MKYWILTTEYPPLYGGGIGTYAHNAAKMLAAEGEDVTVFVPGKGDTPYAIDFIEGIRVVQVNLHRTPESACLGHVARQSYEFAMTVRDLIRLEGKPDVIESQEYQGLPYFLMQLKALQYPELQGVPIVLSIHAPAFVYLHYNRDNTYRFPHYWTGEMEWGSIAAADHIIAPSHYILDAIRGFGPLPEERVSMVRYPFLPATVPPTPRIKKGKLVFWGKLSAQKGVFPLLEYMSRLWDDGLSCELVMMGGKDIVYHPEGRTMGQILEEKYARYIQRGLLTFPGKINPADMGDYLSEAHAIIIPSTLDNLPFACIEAMALGKVMLVSKQGGQHELIEDGVTGFIFDHGDPESFRRQLERILKTSDEDLTRIGQNAARHIARELDYKKVYEQKMAILKKVTTERTSFPYTHAIPTKTLAAGRGLTVVIPYYNMGAYIRPCIDSLRASLLQPDEILIVNDGSRDQASLDALDGLAGEPGIRIIHQLNAGLSQARNVGAAAAKGDYLAFLDADDTVHPQYYRKSVRVLDTYPDVTFVGSWVQYFGATDHVWPAWNPELPYILLHNSVCSGSLVYKRAAFLAGGLNDRKLEYGLEDYDSVLGMIAAGYRGVVLPEPLFNYRIRKDSMMRRMTLHKTLYSYQHIASKYPDLYARYAVELFCLLNANGPAYAFDNPSLEMIVSAHQEVPDGLRSRLKERIKQIPALKRVLLTIKSMLS